MPCLHFKPTHFISLASLRPGPTLSWRSNGRDDERPQLLLVDHVNLGRSSPRGSLFGATGVERRLPMGFFGHLVHLKAIFLFAKMLKCLLEKTLGPCAGRPHSAAFPNRGLLVACGEDQRSNHNQKIHKGFLKVYVWSISPTCQVCHCRLYLQLKESWLSPKSAKALDISAVALEPESLGSLRCLMVFYPTEAIVQN